MTALILLSLLSAEPKSLIGFRGFSADGKQFAWVAPGASKDLELAGNIAQSPPKLALVRGARRVELDLGKYPYEKTDVVTFVIAPLP